MSKLNSVEKAVVFIAIWQIITIALYVTAVKIAFSLAFFMVSFLVLYPIDTVVCSFMVTKRIGLKWYIPIPMVIITVVEYFFFGFNSVQPNIIVSTIICLIFGCGFGNIFADKIRYDTKGFVKQRKKDKAEEDYKSIID